MDPDAGIPADEPSVFNYVLSFLLVGVAWGFTTPFIRRAAADFNARQEAKQAQSQDPAHSIPQQSNSPTGAEEQELQPQNAHRNSTPDSQLHADPNSNSNSNSDEDPDQPLSQAQEPTQAPLTRPPAWMKDTKQTSWLKAKIISVFWTVVNLLRTPAYAIPLIINLTGSIWFFLLVGKHELSLTVPLANSSAFLFTVLGEWYVERKVIAKETWLGMALVLGGIGLCVQSKTM